MLSTTRLTITAMAVFAAISKANAAKTYYVAEDGDDAADGLTKATAKATIAAGMACL